MPVTFCARIHWQHLFICVCPHNSELYSVLLYQNHFQVITIGGRYATISCFTTLFSSWWVFIANSQIWQHRVLLRLFLAFFSRLGQLFGRLSLALSATVILIDKYARCKQYGIQNWRVYLWVIDLFCLVWLSLISRCMDSRV